ncbi:MAG: leucine-rich repeat protein [Clostridia bacterium]|nr:leucine-rich repeat protein [Clostridia bacterium]
MKTMKKTLAALLALALLLGLGSAALAVDPGTAAHFDFPIESQFGMNHRMLLEQDGTMTLTGKGELIGEMGGPLPEGVENDYGIVIRFKDFVKKIVISEGTTSIAEGAFRNYDRLKEAGIPSTVRSIFGEAFYRCASLERIDLPAALTMLDGDAFNGCTSLTEVKLPDALTWLGHQAFIGCVNLREITGGKSLSHVGFNVFGDTAWMNAQPDGVVCFGTFAVGYKGGIPADGLVTVPEGVKYLTDSLFDGQTELVGVTLPSSLETIGWFAFNQCGRLSDVRLPDGLKEIGESAFEACKALTEIRIPAGVKRISRSAFAHTGLKTVTIEPGVQEICDDAFSNCTALEEIDLPEGITVIGSSAFALDKDLKRIAIPRSVKTIGNSAFYECEKMEDVTIPEGVREIEPRAFYHCAALKTLKLPDSVETIQYALENITGLEEITLPASLSSFGSLFTCRALKKIVFEGSEQEWAALLAAEGTNVNMLNGIEVVIAGRPAATAETVGDVDADGQVTAADARLVLRAAVDLQVFGLYSKDKADADRDGQITAADARKVLRAAVELEDRTSWL